MHLWDHTTDLVTLMIYIFLCVYVIHVCVCMHASVCVCVRTCAFIPRILCLWLGASYRQVSGIPGKLFLLPEECDVGTVLTVEGHKGSSFP